MAASHENSTAQAICLHAADGYRLAATLYVAAAQRAQIVVAGATGVPQGFYRRFAEHARARGFSVLTLDYRGIGQSRPPSLKGFAMNYLDWARLDLAAAVDFLTGSDLPLYMVGHSFGGHAFGLLPNHQRVERFFTFATGAGWHGWMPPVERLRVQLMWRLVLPLLTRWKGYSPWQMLGLGEDLPQGVFWQWRQWCRYPRYFFDDPAMAGIDAPYAQVTTPMVAANALDDLWALPRSRDAFVPAYRNAPLQRVDIDPRLVGGRIGHMGYFRPHASLLWDMLLDWFCTDNPTTAALPSWAATARG